MADAREPRGETPHTSFRLPDYERRLLNALASALGFTRTQVILHALRRLARAEGVTVPEGDGRGTD